jgi:DNA replication protein DnaC
LVKPIEVDILGQVRVVQGKCQCEVLAYEAEQKRQEAEKRKERIQELFNMANLGRRFFRSTFDTFQVVKGTEEMFRYAMAMVDEWEKVYETGRGLYIYSKTSGNGKSYIAAAIIHGLLRKSVSCIYQSVPDLLVRIQGTFGQKVGETEGQIHKALMDCDLLALDDLGAEKSTEWVEQTLYRIIDGRYARMKPMVITSNLTPKELDAAFGARIADRITHMCRVIGVTAPSFRQQEVIAREQREKTRSRTTA